MLRLGAVAGLVCDLAGGAGWAHTAMLGGFGVPPVVWCW